MTFEEKKKIVINNYFKNECNINITIKEAYTKGFERGLEKAPKSERKTGKWIWNGNSMDWHLGTWCCSECGAKAWWANNEKYSSSKYSGGNFCGVCGADMRGEQDG